MPTPPEGIPWIGWAIVVIALALIGSAPALVTALITRRKTIEELVVTRQQLAQTQAGVSQTLGQVKNSHTENLRVDLDQKFEVLGAQYGELMQSVAGVREDLGGLHSESRDLRKDVAGVRTDARQDRREAAEIRADLTAHLEDVPRIVEEAFEKHTADCIRSLRPPVVRKD